MISDTYSDGSWYVKAECKKICAAGYGELMTIQRLSFARKGFRGMGRTIGSGGDRHAKHLWRETIVSKSEADEFNDGGMLNIAKVGVSWLG